jgi:hypothetical protein
MAPASRPRVFVDADVLFAGAASPSEHGASLVVLRMAEITLLDALTSQQVIAEVERNLADYLPAALPAFRLLVSRCLRVVDNPTSEEIAPHQGLADPKDLPILVAAVREACPWLVTFNGRHFQPGHPNVAVLQPGALVQQVRALLAQMAGDRRG